MCSVHVHITQLVVAFIFQSVQEFKAEMDNDSKSCVTVRFGENTHLSRSCNTYITHWNESVSQCTYMYIYTQR